MIQCRNQGHEWPAIVDRAKSPVKLPEPDPLLELIDRPWPTYAEHARPAAISAPSALEPIPAQTQPKSTPTQSASPLTAAPAALARRPKIHRPDPKGLFA